MIWCILSTSFESMAGCNASQAIFMNIYPSPPPLMISATASTACRDETGRALGARSLPIGGFQTKAAGIL